eukprot:COSAG06_NODE_1996_length_7886_cov_6.036985_10_plen_90_part_00
MKEEHPHDATCVKEEWDEFLVRATQANYLWAHVRCVRITNSRCMCPQEIYVYLVKNICMCATISLRCRGFLSVRDARSALVSRPVSFAW